MTIPPNGSYREHDYEPGNATRYDLILSRDDRGRVVFGWINAPGGGRCMAIPMDAGKVHGGYIAEKLGYDYDRRRADIVAILVWLDAQGVPVYLDEV